MEDFLKQKSRQLKQKYEKIIKIDDKSKAKYELASLWKWVASVLDDMQRNSKCTKISHPNCTFCIFKRK